MKKYTLSITFSMFGTLEDYYKTISKNNRLIHINDIEFEGNGMEDINPQHVSGEITEHFETDLSLKDYMDYFFRENEIISKQECFSISFFSADVVIYTEDEYLE